MVLRSYAVDVNQLQPQIIYPNTLTWLRSFQTTVSSVWPALDTGRRSFGLFAPACVDKSSVAACCLWRAGSDTSLGKAGPQQASPKVLPENYLRDECSIYERRLGKTVLLERRNATLTYMASGYSGYGYIKMYLNAGIK